MEPRGCEPLFLAYPAFYAQREWRQLLKFPVLFAQKIIVSMCSTNHKGLFSRVSTEDGFALTQLASQFAASHWPDKTKIPPTHPNGWGLRAGWVRAQLKVMHGGGCMGWQFAAGMILYFEWQLYVFRGTWYWTGILKLKGRGSQVLAGADPRQVSLIARVKQHLEK